MKPLVTVIIPLFNSEKYLSYTIQSIQQQTYNNIEVIVIDDGSTDNSLAIAKNFENENFKVFTKKNEGAAIARNTGLRNSHGEYIQFLDADDILSPDKIEKQVLALKDNPGKIAVCQYVSFIDKNNLKNLKIPDQSSFMYSTNNPADFLINLWGGNGESNFIQTNCWLVPKNVIDKSGMWREYRCPDDDGEFFARVILNSEGIEYVPDTYNYYRRFPFETTLSSNKSNLYLENKFITIDLKYNYLKQKSNDPRIEKAIAKQYLDFAIFHYPQYAKLSNKSYEHYKKLNQNGVQLPLLGGMFIEFIKNVFGWKVARLLRYILREKNSKRK